MHRENPVEIIAVYRGELDGIKAIVKAVEPWTLTGEAPLLIGRSARVILTYHACLWQDARGIVVCVGGPMETLLGLLIGVGLSAACGFRVFVPLWLVSFGSWSGHISPSETFQWVGSTPALVAFSVATLVEIIGYLIPWVDHALDVLAIPLAGVAGTVLTGGLIKDLSPFMAWSLAIIAGGGIACATRALMATSRAGLTATTAGLANPIFSFFELVASFVVALMALVVPLLAVGLACLLFIYAARGMSRRLLRGKTA